MLRSQNNLGKKEPALKSRPGLACTEEQWVKQTGVTPASLIGTSLSSLYILLLWKITTSLFTHDLTSRIMERKMADVASVSLELSNLCVPRWGITVLIFFFKDLFIFTDKAD